MHTPGGAFCDPQPGSKSGETPDPGVFGRVAASTPGYKLQSLRDTDPPPNELQEPVACLLSPVSCLLSPVSCLLTRRILTPELSKP